MSLTRTAPLELKSVDQAGRFTGRASVYGVVDSHNDVVMPGAFAKHLAEHGNTIKVLAQHNPHDVIGIAQLVDRGDALWVEGQLELGLQSARDAYLRLKSGLIDGISIGYAVAPGGEKYAGDVRQLHEVELWEISLVTFPANVHARVTAVKTQGADDLARSIKRLTSIIRTATDATASTPLERMEWALTRLRRQLR
jgi:HK97 family phage prohead protease